MVCAKCRPFYSVLNMSLQWRHNERVGVSNHQPHDCLLNRLFRPRSKKTSKLRVTGEFPAQSASNAENVSIWWRHHVIARKIKKGYENITKHVGINQNKHDLKHFIFKMTTSSAAVTKISSKQRHFRFSNNIHIPVHMCTRRCSINSTFQITSANRFDVPLFLWK